MARAIDLPAAGTAAAPSGASPDIWANRSAQIGAARGIAVGLVVGATIGWLAIGMPEPLAGQARSVDPSAMLLAASLLGGALGALIGSLAGLSTPQPRV
ncbi:MAG: hypothetical protein HY332_24530 [Chloroflexi bacterium]|nr:hypothetical protein [Chloroflexota bacterium]